MNILKKIFTDLREGFIKFLGIFTETSITSLMRFMSFFIFWFAMFETNYIITNYGESLTSNQIFLILTLFAFAFFPKVLQKIIEKKYNVKEKELENEKIKNNHNEIS